MMHFYFELASLSIILLYVVLVFRNIDPLVATAIGVGLGFLFNWSSPIEIGHTIEHALGSFLALIGFIIMLGRGLGEVLTETKVSHTLVHKIVYSIGVNTQTKVKAGVILSSLVIVAVLGTLAGGLAILAPILCPIAANVGLSRPSLAILMQAAGEEALILGPFAPPVVALLGVTGLSYETMLVYAALPIVLVTMTTTWFMAKKLQQRYPTELFDHNENEEQFKPTPQQNIATITFVITFIACVVFGLIFKAKTSYVIFVMLFLSITTGFISSIGITQIFTLLVTGMKKNFNLFLIFVLFDPFLNLVQSAGGFQALTQVFTPLIHLGSKPILSILIGITGAFGMPGAAAAIIKMLDQMFSPAAVAMQLSMTTFAFSMLLATRVCNFAYPGANMFAAMGFAGSSNIKAMIQNGLTVTVVQIMFLVIYSFCFA